MKISPFRRRPRQDNVAALYGAIVAQARSPVFYREYGIPDTVAGRLEMILLHTFLFCRRAARERSGIGGLSQGVFDHFCHDMDANLRELGVGDLAVPRHMQRIGEAFYGRSAAYELALAAADEQALAAALMRNVFGGDVQQSERARKLAGYVTAAARRLAGEDDKRFIEGHIDFPDPHMRQSQQA